MGRRLPTTPRSRVRSALRRLSLRCRERQTALKAAKYTCVRCGAKQSRARGHEVSVEAHHRWGIKWEEMIDFVFSRLFQTPADYEILCKTCHEVEEQR